MGNDDDIDRAGGSLVSVPAAVPSGHPATTRRSLPLGAAAIAITVYYSFDIVLLGAFRGSEEVAFYSAAYRIILPILALAGAVGTVAIPHLSFLVTSDDPASRAAVTRLARQLVLCGLPLAVGGALTAEPIIRVVYGPEFAPAVAPFQILIWSVATVLLERCFRLPAPGQGSGSPLPHCRCRRGDRQHGSQSLRHPGRRDDGRSDSHR